SCSHYQRSPAHGPSLYIKSKRSTAQHRRGVRNIFTAKRQNKHLDLTSSTAVQFTHTLSFPAYPRIFSQPQKEIYIRISLLCKGTSLHPALLPLLFPLLSFR